MSFSNDSMHNFPEIILIIKSERKRGVVFAKHCKAPLQHMRPFLFFKVVCSLLVLDGLDKVLEFRISAFDIIGDFRSH
jgi:hypothetical protein